MFTAIVLLAPTVLASTVTAPEKPKTAPRTVDEIIHDSAIEYGVSEVVMRNVIKCESSFNPNAIGDGGHSYGLVQIHLPSHPYVSKEEALDPEYAVDFLAKNLAVDKGSMWTCYRMLY